jgi:altronate dehydratase small subunit
LVMKKNKIIALKINSRDNVAVVFGEAKANSTIEVIDKSGRKEEITLKNDIFYGHKFAIKPVKRGDPVLKYGEALGVASCDIAVGEHVHVHNLESIRGRGDKQ